MELVPFFANHPLCQCVKYFWMEICSIKLWGFDGCVMNNIELKFFWMGLISYFRPLLKKPNLYRFWTTFGFTPNGSPRTPGLGDNCEGILFSLKSINMRHFCIATFPDWSILLRTDRTDEQTDPWRKILIQIYLKEEGLILDLLVSLK